MKETRGTLKKRVFSLPFSSRHIHLIFKIKWPLTSILLLLIVQWNVDWAKVSVKVKVKGHLILKTPWNCHKHASIGEKLSFCLTFYNFPCEFLIFDASESMIYTFLKIAHSYSDNSEGQRMRLRVSKLTKVFWDHPKLGIRAENVQKYSASLCGI